MQFNKMHWSRSSNDPDLCPSHHHHQHQHHCHRHHIAHHIIAKRKDVQKLATKCWGQLPNHVKQLWNNRGALILNNRPPSNWCFSCIPFGLTTHDIFDKTLHKHIISSPSIEFNDLVSSFRSAISLRRKHNKFNHEMSYVFGKEFIYLDSQNLSI